MTHTLKPLLKNIVCFLALVRRNHNLLLWCLPPSRETFLIIKMLCHHWHIIIYNSYYMPMVVTHYIHCLIDNFENLTKWRTNGQQKVSQTKWKNPSWYSIKKTNRQCDQPREIGMQKCPKVTCYLRIFVWSHVQNWKLQLEINLSYFFLSGCEIAKISIPPILSYSRAHQETLERFSSGRHTLALFRNYTDYCVVTM